MARIRIILADDHALFRAGVRALLERAGDIQVVAEAADGREALRLVALQRPDVILMDVMMPKLNGLDAAARITRAFPHTRVVMVSMSSDEDSVLRAFRAGAVGYLIKTDDPTELELAIRAAARGAKPVSPDVSGHVIAASLKPLAPGQPGLQRLTPRLREVLQLVAEGHTTKEIATTLGITVKTAETYRGELMKTLRIHDTAGLTRYAIRIGLVSPDS